MPLAASLLLLLAQEEANSASRGFDALPLGLYLDPAPEVDQDPLGKEPPHGSFSGFWERHASSDAWKGAVWDQYLTQPAVILPISLAVAAVVVIPFDHRLEEQWHGLLGGKQSYSNIAVYTLIGASALTGVLFPGEGRNSWDEGWTIAESFLVSYATTSVLKASVSRFRPEHGTHSFPSGHSSMAFTGATLMDLNSGPVLGIPAYGLAAFTAFARVESGRHFPSDVLAGAAIGTLSAGIFDALHWGGKPGKGGIALDVQGLHSVALQVDLGF